MFFAMIHGYFWATLNVTLFLFIAHGVMHLVSDDIARPDEPSLHGPLQRLHDLTVQFITAGVFLTVVFWVAHLVALVLEGRWRQLAIEVAIVALIWVFINRRHIRRWMQRALERVAEVGGRLRVVQVPVRVA